MFYNNVCAILSRAIFAPNMPLLDLQSQSAIGLLTSQPVLLENLRKAHQGNYGVILSLLGCLDNGLQAKKFVDRVIDACTLFGFINIRSYYRGFVVLG